MYIVRNLTNRTVILADIRAEIGPYRILDLERVAQRSDIENSNDLRRSLENGPNRSLQFVKQTVVRLPDRASPRVEDKLDENRLKEMIEKTIKDQLESMPQNNLEDVIARAMTKAMGALQGKTTVTSEPIETEIDPEKLAEMQQRAIEKMSGEITTTIRQGKRIKLQETKDLKNLANEL